MATNKQTQWTTLAPSPFLGSSASLWLSWNLTPLRTGMILPLQLPSQWGASSPTVWGSLGSQQHSTIFMLPSSPPLALPLGWSGVFQLGVHLSFFVSPPSPLPSPEDGVRLHPPQGGLNLLSLTVHPLWLPMPEAHPSPGCPYV